jgi:hypothetical protein
MTKNLAHAIFNGDAFDPTTPRRIEELAEDLNRLPAPCHFHKKLDHHNAGCSRRVEELAEDLNSKPVPRQFPSKWPF